MTVYEMGNSLQIDDTVLGIGPYGPIMIKCLQHKLRMRYRLRAYYRYDIDDVFSCRRVTR